MNIRLIDIIISLKGGQENIDFTDFNYFYGQMGSGKSSIARLIDFCLGGDMGENEMTPALQAEFISASLSLKVEESPLVLERNAHSNQVRAWWSIAEQNFEVLIPAQKAEGEVIPCIGVEVLSDQAVSKRTQFYNCSTSLTGSENHLSSLRFQTFNRKVF
jgi:hypothetical protein